MTIIQQLQLIITIALSILSSGHATPAQKATANAIWQTATVIQAELNAPTSTITQAPVPQIKATSTQGTIQVPHEITYLGQTYPDSASNERVLSSLNNLDAQCASTTTALQGQYQAILGASHPGQSYWPGGTNPQQASAALQAEENQCTVERQDFMNQFNENL